MIVVGPLIQVTIIALNVYLWIVFAYVIMGWLVNFRVINLQNQFVSMVWEFLVRITDPVLRRIRRFLPTFGGMDISPIVLWLLILFAQMVLTNLHNQLVFG